MSNTVSELTIEILKFSFLTLLWLFVFSAVSVMRRDLFDTETATSGGRGRSAARGGGQPPRERGAQRGTPTKLVITQGANAGAAMPLGTEPITIGRAQECTIAINDDYASSHHARLYCRNGQWFAEDLGSTNGTFLDRMRLDGPTPLPMGVPLRVGGSALELRK